MRENLQAARKGKKLTQQAMAELLGITSRAYQNIEYGHTLGSIKHWDMLEDLFGIPQRELRSLSPQDNQEEH